MMKEISLSNVSPVMKELKTQDEESGAFVCERENFIKIYQLAKCRRNSIWPASYVLQLKLKAKDKDNKLLDLKKADDFLLKIIKNRIRRGDAVCHWDKSHFVTLLYNIEPSQVKIVYDRIKYFFYTNFDNPNKVKLSYNTHEVV